jgi:serine/threonine-protein kinase HipA
VLAVIADDGSLERLFELIVVSVGVGNLDLHAKNISLFSIGWTAQ